MINLFFFQRFKRVISLSSHLCGFWWEINFQFYWYSSVLWVTFSLVTFKILFVFVLHQFAYGKSRCWSLCLSYLEFIELLGSVDECFSSNMRPLWPLFFHVFFPPLLRLLLCMWLYPTCTEALLFFAWFFFLSTLQIW